MSTSVAHEDPQLLADLYALARSRPTDRFVISSGDRTRQPASSTYGIEAAEGTSLHELYHYGRHPYDEAIDVEVNGSPIATLGAGELATFDLQTPVLGDPIHLTQIGWNG